MTIKCLKSQQSENGEEAPDPDLAINSRIGVASLLRRYLEFGEPSRGAKVL
jgi:hypothetical protein